MDHPDPRASLPGGRIAPEAAWLLLDASRDQPAPEAALVCASARIAQSWLAEDALRQHSAGRQAWRSAPILAVDRFLRESYERASLRAAAAGHMLPAVLESAQERALWRSIVDQAARAKLLRSGEAAQLAAEAWRLARDWRLPLPIAGVGDHADATQFNEWAAQFHRRLQAIDAIDAAGLPEALAAAAHADFARFPAHLLLAGFEELTPALAALLATLSPRGVQIDVVELPVREPTVHRAAAADTERELRAAADWARDALAAGATRIGVVVTQLRARRAVVQRVFTEALPTEAVGIGVAEPLAGHSMIQAALGLLSLRAGKQPLDEITALLLSPYWDGGEAERQARSRVDLRLRQDGYLDVDLAQISSLAAALGAGGFAERCRRLLLQRVPGERLSPAGWTQRFAEWLDAAGWPGDRVADAREQDIRRRWAEALGDFATLGAVLTALPQAAALAQLREIAERSVLPQSGAAAPVQLLDPGDSTGLSFDRLWVAGLDDQRWPPPARPNPLLPFALQRNLGMPGADAIRELEQAIRRTRGWLVAADEVVLSHALHEDDRELQPSPLLPDAAQRVLETPPHPVSWTQIYAARRLETVDDASGVPTAQAEPLRGGTGLFADQAKCPFRAYAHYRLGAEAAPEPGFGLDDRDRGNLVHEALHNLWESLRTQAALKALDAEAQLARVRAAVDQAIARFVRKAPQRLGPALADLERRRLTALLDRWLALERERAPFDVAEIEGRAPGVRDAPRVRDVQGVPVTIRPDRIDRLADGRTLVLDYKTGEVSGAPWSDPRPDQPQLLVYALDRADSAGVAFAQVRAGKMRLHGIADDSAAGNGIAAYGEDRDLAMLTSWTAVLEQWRVRIALLGAEIRAGFAAVQPKLYPQVCDLCDLHAFCRVRESRADLDAPDEAPESP